MRHLFITPHSYAIAIIRITLGVIIFAHGAQKVLGWFGGYGLKGTVGYFTSIGIPLPIAYLVCFTEFLGGLALILGFLTRPAALGVAAVMVGAILKVHLRNGFFMNWELAPGKQHGLETNLALLAMALACILAGGGAFSVDRLLY
jgi:putative oxidoreductase